MFFRCLFFQIKWNEDKHRKKTLIEFSFNVSCFANYLECAKFVVAKDNGKIEV